MLALSLILETELFILESKDEGGFLTLVKILLHLYFLLYIVIYLR